MSEKAIKRPWDELTSNSILRRVNAVAERAKLDDEARGRLLHHVANCPECQAKVKK